MFKQSRPTNFALLPEGPSRSRRLPKNSKFALTFVDALLYLIYLTSSSNEIFFMRDHQPIEDEAMRVTSSFSDLRFRGVIWYGRAWLVMRRDDIIFLAQNNRSAQIIR